VCPNLSFYFFKSRLFSHQSSHWLPLVAVEMSTKVCWHAWRSFLEEVVEVDPVGVVASNPMVPLHSLILPEEEEEDTRGVRAQEEEEMA
jgi:hypothetical protein